MKVRANRACAKFRRHLERRRELLRPWQGASYRVTTLDYPRPASILSGEGSFLFGGRWNAPGAFRAVYGSTSDVVAVAESRANAEYAGMPYPFRTPRLLVAIEFDLRRVLDLTTAEARDALGITFDEFRDEDWRKMEAAGTESCTQAFGRAAYEIGANAILVPSARVPDGVNIAYFPENLEQSAEATICEPEKLDRIQGVD